MQVHVLNGDALTERFPFQDQLIICREALIDGPTAAGSLDDFFELRAAFISETYDVPAEAYYFKVKTEFDKLVLINDTCEINLWFEFDLFCQVNLWFTLYLIHTSGIKNNIFLVTPDRHAEHTWSGFGDLSSPQLNACYDQRIQLSQASILLASNLWTAYSKNDFQRLRHLSTQADHSFPFISEVVSAHIERFPTSGIGRPQRRLQSILDSGVSDFQIIFKEFSTTEGVYGFGDAQVARMLTRL